MEEDKGLAWGDGFVALEDVIADGGPVILDMEAVRGVIGDW